MFLIPDLRTHPFGYPDISEEDDMGNQIVTYPVRYTEGRFPHLDDNYKLHKVQTAAVAKETSTSASKRSREQEDLKPNKRRSRHI